mmetsp:Transcript_127931/g.368563  ORF Transcript_127931/g.368563 Transcript_127931/m.368563 type:complete len:230 (+) Transcript_127931:93-782(+)
MGASCSRDDNHRRIGEFAPAPVVLHIYDLGNHTKAVNNLLRKIGTGAFHCGVEVYGAEWSYSDVKRRPGEEVSGSGLFCCPPTRCEDHSYSESIPMGTTMLSEGEVFRLLQQLKREWPISMYSTLRKNCCHFCEELCQRLGVGSIPNWVKNLAGAGAAIVSAGNTVCCKAVCNRASESTAALCCGQDPQKDSGEEVVFTAVEILPVLGTFRAPDGRPPSVDSVDKAFTY